tara:strand:+ start:697 stop:1260 length:564 start_codon:yes stop_codon:yes gene_type:complete
MEQTTAPTGAVLTTAEVKTHLRITHSDDDSYIDALVATATAAWESATGMQLLTATWTDKLNNFPSYYRLNIRPFDSVTSVKYVDTDDTEQTLSSDLYWIDESELTRSLVFRTDESLPNLGHYRNSVSIIFTAGYSSASDVPEDIKHCLKAMVGTMYENREGEQPRQLFGQWFGMGAMVAKYGGRSVW